MSLCRYVYIMFICMYMRIYVQCTYVYIYMFVDMYICCTNYTALEIQQINRLTEGEIERHRASSTFRSVGSLCESMPHSNSPLIQFPIFKTSATAFWPGDAGIQCDAFTTVCYFASKICFNTDNKARFMAILTGKTSDLIGFCGVSMGILFSSLENPQRIPVRS